MIWPIGFYRNEKLFVIEEAEQRLFVFEKQEWGKDSSLPMYKEVITVEHYDYIASNFAQHRKNSRSVDKYTGWA